MTTLDLARLVVVHHVVRTVWPTPSERRRPSTLPEEWITGIKRRLGERRRRRLDERRGQGRRRESEGGGRRELEVCEGRGEADGRVREAS